MLRFCSAKGLEQPVRSDQLAIGAVRSQRAAERRELLACYSSLKGLVCTCL